MSTEQPPALRDYEVAAPLAWGTTGVFYAGRHRLTGHAVALQRMAPHLCAAAGFVDRLGNAARQVAALRNPSLVGVYDLVVEDGDVFLVLELVAGPSLRELAPAGQVLPPAPALAAVDDVLAALETAHAAGVVHGDVRAEHVLVTPQGVAKLGGFAVAEALQVLPNHPGAKRPGYSSPERLAGLQPDARSDLYATAALASELMTGVAPAPGRVGPAALPAVAEVLKRALSPDATVRFDSATELRSALVGAVSSSLGPAWRLASDLGARAATALAARGGGAAAALAGASDAAGGAVASAPANAPAAGSAPTFGAPPPPGASVLLGATPPPPLARPPSAPPPSYLPPPAPRARAAITELDSEERSRRGVLKWVFLGIGAVLVLAGLAVGGVVLLRGNSTTTGGSAGPLQVGNDVRLSVVPQSGGCDTDFEFAATGSLTGQGSLVYRWQRSDGQQSADIPVTITNEGSFRFTIAWRVIGHQQLSGMMTFRIVSPTSRVVNQGITYNCP